MPFSRPSGAVPKLDVVGSYLAWKQPALEHNQPSLRTHCSALWRRYVVSVPFGNEESVFVPCRPRRAVQKDYILDTEQVDDAVPVPTIQWAHPGTGSLRGSIVRWDSIRTVGPR